MTPVYDKSGIRFAYPENWEIGDENLSELPRSVSVQSPNGGFWMLNVHSSAAEPQSLVDTVLSTMQEEYEEIEYYPFREPLIEAMTYGYDLNFYVLDLLITARVQSFRWGVYTLLVITQAEDRDFQANEPVYDAITASLLREL